MPRTVIAGIDGSRESRAAAAWAAREAARRGFALTLLHVWQAWSPAFGYAPLGVAAMLPDGLEGPDSDEPRAQRMLDEVYEWLRDRRPDVDITAEQVPGRPAEILRSAADEAEVLVLGSRALDTLTGFLTRSVSMAVLAHARRPVVLVRPTGTAEDGEQAGPEDEARGGGGPRDVVLGLDLSRPCDPLIEYAVEAARVRGAGLRVVHTWSPPPVFGYDPAAVDSAHVVALGAAEASALEEAMRPWRAEFPSVRIETLCVADRPAERLVEAAEDAALLVVGRRVRSGVTHIGPVTHAVLHHARPPVAVVAHP
ncbi:universal stress protein [Streptomyces sp. NPDC058301]|uniref:universal stress protein n=1 Tax=Streptomyces sp. NPDC058301 TaxID=3346436 RepID=UPI0036E72537